MQVSRIEMGTFSVEPTLQNIVYLSEEIIKELEVLINKKQIKLIKEFDYEIGELNLDKNLITIVLQNIFSNAIKYTPENGTVKIKLYKIPEYLRIEVSDSG
ncbi:MAG: sensor histidine kinase, partial [Desulfatiglandales bacterium]